MLTEEPVSDESREFYKLSGAGNDFVAQVLRDGAPPDPEQLTALCRRGLSVGADGILLLERRPTGARLVHRNADGSRSDLCLNGSRCAARLAFRLGWTRDAPDPTNLDLETDAGTLHCLDLASPEGTADRVATSLPASLTADTPRRRTLRIDGPDGGDFTVDGWFLRVGVPHLVVRWDDLENLPIAHLGPRLRRHPDLGPEGANVDFVQIEQRPDEGSKPGGSAPGAGSEPGARHFAAGARHFAMRSWERGVEGETLACGTGAVAAARCAKEAGWLGGSTSSGTAPFGTAPSNTALDVTVTTASGFDLTVGELLDGSGHLVTTLAGDARVVARGTWLAGALAAPRRPRWAP